MSNIDYIFNLCLELQTKGKTPSVALIRKLSTKPLAIPEVIKGLQNWKSSPNQEKKPIPEIETPKQNTNTLEQRVELLERQLATVMKELANLKQSN